LCRNDSDAKGQGHTGLKIDLEAWQRYQSWPPWVEQLFQYVIWWIWAAVG